MIDGFGMIAMVAMTPIIALQTLGFIFKIKSEKGDGRKWLINLLHTTRSLVCIIVNNGLAGKICHRAKELGVLGGTVALGMGTSTGKF